MNIQFKKGIIEYCVLSILREKDCYGYELVNDISKHMSISEGTIYPLLRRLKRDNLVETYLQESSDGPPRKYYHLTSEGIIAQTQFNDDWMSFKKSINAICNPIERKENE